jgi:cytoskeletal protein CcmA (bactofilin family)
VKKGMKTSAKGTYLGPDSSIEGTIEFRDTIWLDGNVTGKISSNGGMVIIGQDAVVNAEIIVGVARIMGEVNGTITASDRIELKSPARVIGDIQAPEISIEEKVVFNGNCVMRAQQISSSSKKTIDFLEKSPLIETSKS